MKEAIEKLEEQVKDVINAVGWELMTAKHTKQFNEMVEKIGGLKETLEKLKTEAEGIDITKAEREALDGIYREQPELKKEGIGNFDGYYLTYDKFLDAINQAWPNEKHIGYDQDPLELVTRLGYLNAERQIKETLMLMKKVNGLLFDALQMLDKEKPLNCAELGFDEMEKIIKAMKKPPRFANRPFIRKLQSKLDAERAAAAGDINEAVKETVEDT